MGRDGGVSRYRLQGLGMTLQEQHVLCLSHLLQAMSSAAAEGPQSSSWKGQKKSPCPCPGDVHSLVVPMR